MRGDWFDVFIEGHGDLRWRRFSSGGFGRLAADFFDDHDDDDNCVMDHWSWTTIIESIRQRPRRKRAYYVIDTAAMTTIMNLMT